MTTASSTPPGSGQRPPGNIITFYSYKGGAGRTMALANVAWILASAGHRVLAVDWDLESPGLHRYFKPFLLDKNLRTSRGVIDMVRDYADAMLQPLSEGEDPDWISTYTDVLRYAVSLDWEFDPPPAEADETGQSHRRPAGYLDLLPAGRQDSTYTTAVGTFDWTAFFERLGGNAFLEALASNMRENYDYVLVDSRTGVGDGTGICTIRLPDTVVASFTMNDQSMDGAVAVARSIVRQREQSVRLLPVPMRVEDAEQGKLEAGRDHARRSFAPFLPRMSAEQFDRYWGDIEIPYKPFYAYEEILAPFGDRPRQEGTLLAAYERLTREVSGGAVENLVAMDERRRRRWLPAFERTRPGTGVDLLISYAAVDRMWAEWIGGELSDTGLRVNLREVDFSSPTAGVDTLGESETSQVVALLSQDYVQSPNAAELWKQTIDREPTGSHQYLVPIRLDSARLPLLFTGREPLELAGLSEERAREQLLAAFERPDLPGRETGSAGSGTLARKRFPNAEPPIWNVPPRNVTFTGRRALLEDIRDRLSAADTVVAPQALHGLGGVGKTQTALEYAHRFRADYDVVWWVSARQLSVVRGSLAELADQLGVAAGTSVSERVQEALASLRRGQPFRRWLLIYDNAEEPAELRDLIPQGPGHTLLTTRNQAWPGQAMTVEVGVFSRAESIAFLRRRAMRLTEAEASVIAERLGDLPLAVEQAGAWLATTGDQVETYLERLDRQLPQMLSEELPPDYQETGAQPWLVSLGSLRERNPAAAKLLEVCAFFAAEPIPMPLVTSERFASILVPYDSTLRDPLLVQRAIREIGRYALARIEASRSSAQPAPGRSADDSGAPSVQLHPLVQAVIRVSLPTEEANRNREHVHAILAERNPKDPDRPENWPRYAELWPHIIPAKTVTSEQPEVRQLLLDMARYLWKRVDYTTCEELATEAIDRWQRHSGKNDPQTLLMRFHLANALRLRARYSAAYEIDRDVHERLQSALGAEHPYTLMVASSLAGDLRALGRFTEARDLDEQTEPIARDVFGEYNALALNAAHNLAVSLRLVGDLRRALQLDEDTLNRRRAALGERHPNTLYSAGNYGRDLRDTGDLRESRRVLEATVEAHREVLGADHPETLRAMKNYAVTLRKIGEFDRSQEMSMDTLVRTQRVFQGPDHPDVQACAMNLACDESALGQDEAALRRAAPVYEWWRQNMGEDHLFTLAYGSNVAIFLRKVGRAEEGYQLNQKMVDRFAAVAGADHPYTLAATINLSNCLYDRGDFEAARQTDEQEYERIRRLLGPDHPDTLAAANNLATSRTAVGDRAGAQELRRSVLPIFRRVLGDDHPNTIALTEENRLNCDLEPPPT
ncbi:FxSxx-COOH system tetratricopeptide repeat protein [Solwaraspora sp. WMMD1047]|uniref:FxSxx-COOH system tetratricopeptide repeat protein n=1 Tax=Solwaraspora sp. WMMD1047 TaxID=3016102 RepID=UPI002415EBE5|nr:FxSxx-COOH system tetratricopeptide repeat protein [Solwaraspora sp. WMMD1047]MDG4831526.1 FxSxx-COOH system tetratricopeptide repeat protein [Solwaraspora sp. WMMD1047]